MRILSVANCPALDHLGSGYVIGNFVSALRDWGHEIDLLEPDDHEVGQFLRPRAIGYRQALGMLFAVTRALRRALLPMRTSVGSITIDARRKAKRCRKSQPSRERSADADEGEANHAGDLPDCSAPAAGNQRRRRLRVLTRA